MAGVRRGRFASVCLLATLVALLPAGSARAHDVSCAPESATGGDWPMFGNQLTGDRVQPAEHFINASSALTLQPAWTFDADRGSRTTNNEITGHPIVSRGCVYVGSSRAPLGPDGWVFAINADNGELVWRLKTKGNVYNSVAVANGIVYAYVSRVSSPYVAAIDQFTGDVLWESTVDFQVGADAVGSPIVYDGMVWVGVSGTAAEISEGDRATFQGLQVLLDAQTGAILKKTYTIPEDVWHEGFAGGGIWSTIGIDPETGYGYVGTGNPFDYDDEHERTNSMLKTDLAKARDLLGNPLPSPIVINPDFGKIVGHYKGNVEQYTGAIDFSCQEIQEVAGVFLGGLECLHLDLDFGASVNIFTDASGRRLVGAGQKSGVYHVVDADTMEQVWTSTAGIPGPQGGIVGSAAYDGENIIGPHTTGGYLWSIGKEGGGLNWVAPVGSGINWGPPVTIANRIAYTVDLSGFLLAYDAATGLPLARRPMLVGADVPNGKYPFSWGAVTVARSTVFASAGVGLTSVGFPSLPTGFVIAFRPASVPLPN